jgi:hypothetical protein
MKSIDQLMNIDMMINDNGGGNFIKIRMMFDDIDRLASEGNAKALRFIEELGHVHDVILVAIKNDII